MIIYIHTANLPREFHESLPASHLHPDDSLLILFHPIIGMEGVLWIAGSFPSLEPSLWSARQTCLLISQSYYMLVRTHEVKYVCNACMRTCLHSGQSVNNVNTISTYGAADTEQHTLFRYVIFFKMALWGDTEDTNC